VGCLFVNELDFKAVGLLKVGIFFFQPFVLKQKVEPKIQADSKGIFHYGQRSPLLNRPFPTTVNWLGLTDEVFSSCRAKQLEALYSPAAAGRGYRTLTGISESLSLCVSLRSFVSFAFNRLPKF
jgi:hypothetical protein